MTVEIITNILNQGRGIAISDIRDMINNDNPEIDMKNNELKAFLEEEFQTNIQFCLSDSKNKSQFVYSSSVSVNDAINKLRSLDCVKNAAEHIRKVLLNVDFGLEDGFCDAQELKNSYSNTQLPGVLLTFFASLFNVNRTMLMKESLEEGEICLFDEDEEDYHENSNDQHQRLNLKMKTIFQNLFDQVVHGCKNTTLHILKAHAVYEHCRSRALITAFNRQGCSVSYKTMKTVRADIAILKSKDDYVPLPSHFSKSSFTIAAFDNFVNTDRNSFSGTKHSHDTAITVFQEKLPNSINKPKKSAIELKSIKKLQKLKCQELVFLNPNSPKLPLPDSFASFATPEDLLNLEIKTGERNQKQFIISCAQNITKSDSKYLKPSWAGIESLISESDVPITQVGFLPFIPNPVTNYSTVYTVMLNMTKLTSQLDQKILPVYCDEGVFRIVIDIYFQRRNQFQNLMPMLGSFHIAKCLEHCIRKYIDDTGIDDCLSQTKVAGVKRH